MIFRYFLKRKIKAIYPSFDVGRVDEIHKDYKSRFFKKLISQRAKPTRLLGQNGVWFLLRSLYRSNSMFNGLSSSILSRNRGLAFFSVRAHFETTGAVSYFYNSLCKFYEEKLSYEELDMILKRLVVGGKTFSDDDSGINLPEPFNVLKLIDEADKLFSKMAKEKHQVFRDQYNFLSEFCHPNCLALTLNDEMPKLGTVLFHKKPDFKSADFSQLLHTFCASCTLFFPIYDKCFSIIQKKEEIPHLIK